VCIATSEEVRQALGTGVLLSLLSDHSCITAAAAAKVDNPNQHVRTSWRTQLECTTHTLPSFYWSLSALWTASRESFGSREPKELLAGVRMTKHVLCPTYSDSLSFDVKRTHTANLTHKAQQPGAPTSKRMKTALEDACHVPAKAHLGVTSLPQLMQAYMDYSSNGAPIVPMSDWREHFSRCREGSEPLSCLLSERPSQLFKHALSPELLLNPELNDHALEAGITLGAHLRASRQWRWLLIGDSPSETAPPPQLAQLIDDALAAKRQRQRARKRTRKREACGTYG